MSDHVTGQEITPPSDKFDDGFRCIVESDTSPEGIVIEGHKYVAVVAFLDCDTERWYSVLRCERCGQPSVSWTTDPDDAREMSEGHPYQEVGDKRS